MPTQSTDAILLAAQDNIAVATRHLPAASAVRVNGHTISLAEPVRFGHKFTVEPIAEGEPVRKFGQVIGFASQAIPVGRHVHTHNVACNAFERDYAMASAIPPAPVADEERCFDGYLRPDGRVGTRNYLAIVSTVNCAAFTARAITQTLSADMLKAYPNVDGIVAITHKTGCGMAASGTDRDYLNRTLAGFARHANVVDYLLVGLGCEINQASELIAAEQLVGRSRPQPKVITIQGAGGIGATVEAGARALAAMLPAANDVRRTRQPAAKILLGTNCGGSDGNSGITANPALGVASDLLVAQGGTSILAETTEIYGAEHLLTRRAVSPAVAEKLIDRIKWWEWYTAVFGAEINNNPSFGNKEGGLTTIYEKSLGAVAKGGTSALTAVYRYAEPVTAKGLVVMDTPGFDPVSVTGIVAGGANVVIFTTGRGSVLGSKPVPCIKVATNTPLYQHMQADMDLDAGVILSGTPVEVVGRQIFDLLLDVASGQKTKSELLGIGEDEFAPWTVGPVL